MEKYIELYGVVKTVLAAIDPEAILYSRGASINVYAPEAKMIVDYISENSNCTTYEIANIVQSTFYKYFNVVYPINKCIDMGGKIKDTIKIMEAINKSLSNFDLEGLMRIDSTYNKYYMEAEDIFSFIIENPNFHITELADEIQNIFLKKYGNLHSIIKCLEIAEIICGR